MSRVGQSVINIHDGVEVKKEDNKFWAKGSKGELTAPINDDVQVIITENEIKVELKSKASKNKASWGTTRALINNAVKGVSFGFEKDIEIVVDVGSGKKSFTAYTMDFSKKYIEINADYRS